MSQYKDTAAHLPSQKQIIVLESEQTLVFIALLFRIPFLDDYLLTYFILWMFIAIAYLVSGLVCVCDGYFPIAQLFINQSIIKFFSLDDNF